MAQLTQYASLAYSLGNWYWVYTLASEMSLTAAASTMFLMTNFRMALSLGTHLEQLVQRTYLTWPLPCLLRPWFLLFEVIFSCRSESSNKSLVLLIVGPHALL